MAANPTYSTEQLCKRLGIDRGTLRRWVRRGVMPAPESRKPTGHRGTANYYSVEALAKGKMVKSLLAKGHSLDAILALQEGVRDSPPVKAPRGGRAEVDLSVLRGLAKIGCTIEEAAIALGVAETTLRDRLSEEEYKRAWDEGVVGRNVKLRRMQVEQAENGNTTMLIWLGKVLLGQKEDRGSQPVELRGFDELVAMARKKDKESGGKKR